LEEKGLSTEQLHEISKVINADRFPQFIELKYHRVQDATTQLGSPGADPTAVARTLATPPGPGDVDRYTTGLFWKTFMSYTSLVTDWL
jgi:hypothetical protein